MTDTRIETELIQRGEGASPVARPVTTPIYAATTFLFASASEVRRQAEGKSDRFIYSRNANPTVVAVEAKLAAAERAESALVFGAGNAATASTLLGLTQAGDEILCCSAVYGGTYHLLTQFIARFGVQVRFLAVEELYELGPFVTERTRALWFETPINPTLRCVDIRRVVAACRAHGITCIVDNTFATPINQQPLDFGVDLVVHSASKYLNGHSDVTAGVVAGPRELLHQIETARRLLGTILDPTPAYALGRGLKTLAVRIRQHNANALAVAQFLEQDHRVQHVYYPGLESHPDHALAKSQMSGFGGMVCADLGSVERAEACYDRLQVFNRAASLGGVESLCSMPVLTSHWGYSDEALKAAGVRPDMLRLSVGIEAVEDLVADLHQALG